MRKFYLCGLFMVCFSLLWGKAPFGIFEEALVEGSSSKQLWHHILNGLPITIDLVLPPAQESNRAQIESHVRTALTMWFTDTAKIIEQSGRAEEFADILPILKRGLVFGSGGLEEHIIMYESLEKLRQDSKITTGLASANRTTRTIRILTQEKLNQEAPYETPLWRAIAHEFGHQLGFIGQYPAEITKDIDRVAPYSYSATAHVHETVMSAVKHQGEIGCDDTDAIINMIDLQRQGAQGIRAGKTWKSFCKQSKDEFRDGKCVTCYAYQIRKNSPRWGDWRVDVGNGFKNYSPQRLVSAQEIVNVKETILARDSKNRPVKTQTNNAATVYYEYFQTLTRKAAFINQELAWTESVYQNHQNNEYVHELEFWAGRPVTLTWSKPSLFSFKEGRAQIQFSCQKSANGKLDCRLEKDTLTRADSRYFGNFSAMDPQSLEYKIAKAAAVNTLIKWFEQLPDKPLLK